MMSHVHGVMAVSNFKATFIKRTTANACQAVGSSDAVDSCYAPVRRLAANECDP